MTREEEIRQVASAYAINEVKDTCNPASKRGLLYSAFIDGAHYADSHPNWISVEDELPKDKGLIITTSLGKVEMFKYEGESAVVLKDWYYITHWMPKPQPPKKGGEK